MPSLDSSQSTPTEELSSQGQSHTDKIECQAETYLNALFRKKGNTGMLCHLNFAVFRIFLMRDFFKYVSPYFIINYFLLCLTRANKIIRSLVLAIHFHPPVLKLLLHEHLSKNFCASHVHYFVAVFTSLKSVGQGRSYR